MARLLNLAPCFFLGFLAACSGAPLPDPEPAEVSDVKSAKEPASEPKAAEEPAEEPTATEPSADEPPPVEEAPATDGGAPADAKTWCTGRKTTFCADFDQAPLPSGFASMDGTLLSVAPEPTRPLMLDIPGAPTGAAFTAKLTQPFAKASNDMTFGFDVMPTKMNTLTGGLHIAGIEFANGDARYSIKLVFVGGHTRIEEYTTGAPTIFHPYFDLPAAKWSRIRIGIVFNAPTSGSLKLTVADKQVGTNQALKPIAGMNRTPTLLLGAVFGRAPHDGWKVGYDNVTAYLR